MAGTDPNFDALAAEAGIRFAMQLGAPVKPQDRATFVFAKTLQYPPGTRLDQEGRPLDPRISPTTEASDRPDVQKDCAIEFSPADADEIPVGNFRPTKVTITMFEKDFEDVKDAREIRIGGDRYLVGYRPPPLALFNLGFQQIVAYALDET